LYDSYKYLSNRFLTLSENFAQVVEVDSLLSGVALGFLWARPLPLALLEINLLERRTDRRSHSAAREAPVR
jgi:hypothetical protein